MDGYNRLDDLSRNIYEKFIVNIFNAWGLESRKDLIPKGIYFVEDIEYLVKEDPDDDCLTVIGGIVNVIDRNGLKYVHQTRIDEAYKHLEIKESEAKTYIRFEYEHEGRRDWLYVVNDGEEWY